MPNREEEPPPHLESDGRGQQWGSKQWGPCLCSHIPGCSWLSLLQGHTWLMLSLLSTRTSSVKLLSSQLPPACFEWDWPVPDAGPCFSFWDFLWQLSLASTLLSCLSTATCNVVAVNMLRLCYIPLSRPFIKMSKSLDLDLEPILTCEG